MPQSRKIFLITAPQVISDLCCTPLAYQAKLSITGTWTGDIVNTGCGGNPTHVSEIGGESLQRQDGDRSSSMYPASGRERENQATEN